jgi:hypothetical protein
MAKAVEILRARLPSIACKALRCYAIFFYIILSSFLMATCIGLLSMFSIPPPHKAQKHPRYTRLICFRDPSRTNGQRFVF